MSTENEIRAKVVGLVASHLGVEADRVVDEAGFVDDLGADSLDIVELVMAFEEEFGIEIHDDKADEIITVGDAVSVIQKMTA